MALKSAVPPTDRISETFKQLADSGARLNSASSELAKAIGPIDAALKNLNLGVTAWHKYAAYMDPETGEYGGNYIGYTRVGRKWGLALSKESGNAHAADSHEEEQWLFNDAPRAMRIEALDHIPKLLEVLVEEANKVVANLHKKSEYARELAETLSALSAATGARS